MRDHTVAVGAAGSAQNLEFAPTFNVAVPFIDRHQEEGRADKVVIRTEAGEVTYAALAENVNRCGNALKALGLKPGDRVLMMVKDCAEFFYLFWGAIKAGFVPVPLNTLLRAQDYAFIIDDSGCGAVVYSAEFATEVESGLERAARLPGHAMLVDGPGETLTSRLKKAGTALEPAPATAEDDCFWLYSSGTTGNPKGAVHAHRDMVVTSQYYGVQTLGLREDDICFSAAKLFFAYGMGNAMTFPLWVGATTVLLEGRPTPETTFATIEKFRPTVYFGVPTLYAAQLRAMDSAMPDVGSLRLCVSAGEALPGDIFHRWREKTGVDILDGIGSTEILHIFISNRTDDIRPGSSGRMVDSYEAKIVDEHGVEVPDGDTGQLLIRGPSIAKYFWNNPGKTEKTMLADGWLATGDTYYRDHDGYYHYCGRADDMLKVGGIWCSPFEIEAKLIEHPKVLEAAVVGQTDDDQLIKPEAFVVLNDPRDSTDATVAELLEHCKNGLAPYKYPRWINFISDLPKTATGKIQRYKLRTL